MQKLTKLLKGSSIKAVRSQGGRSLFSRYYTDEGGFFRCGRLHILVQKNFGFFEIYRTDKRGFEPMRTFFEKGKGSILCGRLLWKAPKLNYLHSCSRFL